MFFGCTSRNSGDVTKVAANTSATVTHGRFGAKTSLQKNQSKPINKIVPQNFISDAKVSPSKLKVITINYKSVVFPLKLNGIISPELGKEVDVAPRISGRIKQILVRPGQFVKKNDVLALIDSQKVSDLQAELIEAKSKLDIAKASELRERKVYEEQILRPKALLEARTIYNENKVQANLSLANLNRVESLYKEKIAAAKDYIQAKAMYEKSRSQLEQSEINLQREEHLFNNKALMQKDYQLAQAETVRAYEHLDTLSQRLVFMGMTKEMINLLLMTKIITGEVKIIAPVSGIISNFDASAGEIIEAEQSFLKITDLSEVEVKANLPEDDLSKVAIDTKVTVIIGPYKNLLFKGVVSYISDRVNPTTHTVLISTLIENKNNLLKTNMNAVLIIHPPPVNALVCPKKAVHTHNGVRYVYKEEEKGFKEVEIVTGRENDSYFEILSGIKQGDMIATNTKLINLLEKNKKTNIVY